MKLAYADPPYFGQGKKLYGKLHPDAARWDDLESHRLLLNELDERFDGWAYSLTSTSLRHILPFAPDSSRVGAWVKPFAAWRPNHRIQFTWEPVIFRSARPKGGKTIPSVRDYHSERIAMKKGLVGAKPDGYNSWILDLIGFETGDEVVDYFPGTNGLLKAMEARSCSTTS